MKYSDRSWNTACYLTNGGKNTTAFVEGILRFLFFSLFERTILNIFGIIKSSRNHENSFWVIFWLLLQKFYYWKEYLALGCKSWGNSRTMFFCLNGGDKKNSGVGDLPWMISCTALLLVNGNYYKILQSSEIMFKIVGILIKNLIVCVKDWNENKIKRILN